MGTSKLPYPPPMVTYLAEVALAKNYTAVVLGTADNECALPGASNAAAILGITQEIQATAGGTVPVAVNSFSWFRGGGACTRGLAAMIDDTDGRLINAGSTVSTLYNVIGQFQETLAATNDLEGIVFIAKSWINYDAS